MIDIIAAVKEFFTLKSAVTTIKDAPKSGVKTTEFWSLILTQAAAVYMGAQSLIPPAWGIGIGIVLSLIWLLARLVLKHYHLSLAAVNGVPELDVDDLVGFLEKQFPALTKAEPQLKDALKTGVDAIKADQPAS